MTFVRDVTFNDLAVIKVQLDRIEAKLERVLAIHLSQGTLGRGVIVDDTTYTPDASEKRRPTPITGVDDDGDPTK